VITEATLKRTIQQVKAAMNRRRRKLKINADDETIKQVNARHGCVCLIPVAGTGMVLPCR
jgi:hypothetical protein